MSTAKANEDLIETWKEIKKKGDQYTKQRNVYKSADIAAEVSSGLLSLFGSPWIVTLILPSSMFAKDVAPQLFETTPMSILKLWKPILSSWKAGSIAVLLSFLFLKFGFTQTFARYAYASRNRLNNLANECKALSARVEDTIFLHDDDNVILSNKTEEFANELKEIQKKESWLDWVTSKLGYYVGEAPTTLPKENYEKSTTNERNPHRLTPIGDLHRTQDSITKGNKYFQKQVSKYQNTFEGSETVTSIFSWMNNIPLLNRLVPPATSALKGVSTYAKWRKEVYDKGLQTTNDLKKKVADALTVAANQESNVNLMKAEELRAELQAVFDETNKNWADAKLKEHQTMVD
jgi:hypothetical protein